MPIITAVIIVFNPLFRFGGGYYSREVTIVKNFLTENILKVQSRETTITFLTGSRLLAFEFWRSF